MKSKYLVGVLGLSVLMSGCVVRTYPLTRDRVDQDLTIGNRGFLQGTAPAAGERKTERTTRVVEIELRSPLQFKKCPKNPVQEPAAVSGEESMGENRGYMSESMTSELSETAGMNFEKYTVQKGDTLQKISQRYFGTTKKWMKIYEANKGTLKGPNKIYSGQVLNIPVAGMSEPTRKLK